MFEKNSIREALKKGRKNIGEKEENDMKIISYSFEWKDRLIGSFLDFVTERKKELSDSDFFPDSYIRRKIEDRIKKYKGSYGKILLIKRDKNILGFSFLTFKDSSFLYIKERYINIDYLYIKKEEQGKGLSSLLKREIEIIGKDKNMKSIKLSVANTNTKAKEIYKKWGFELKHLSLRKNI